MKRVLLVCVLLFGNIQGFASTDDLDKSKGTDQESIVSLVPVPGSTVSQNTKIEAVFNVPLDAKHIKKHDVKLKCLSCKKKKNIKGRVAYGEAEKKVTFTPDISLEPGLYEVEIKSLKADKDHKKTKIKKIKYRFVVVNETPDTTVPIITLNGNVNITLIQGENYEELGATATVERDGDVNVTITGNVDTSTVGTYTITYTAIDKAGNEASATRTVNVEIPPVIVESIYMDANTTLIELSEHNTTQIKVMATYSDNSSEDITRKAIYASSDTSVADVDKGLVRTFKEGSTTVTISYDGKTIKVQVEVYEMIEGHMLPHEPDNPDATLLGVDKNDNGARDEVERWIYKEMPTYHHPEIERVVAMTEAKAYQMVLVDPTNKDDKVHIAIRKASDCWSYYSDVRNLPFDGAIEKFSNRLMDKVFSTRARLSTFMDYENALNAKLTPLVPFTPLRLLNTSYCDQNIDVLP